MGEQEPASTTDGVKETKGTQAQGAAEDVRSGRSSGAEPAGAEEAEEGAASGAAGKTPRKAATTAKPASAAGTAKSVKSAKKAPSKTAAKKAVAKKSPAAKTAAAKTAGEKTAGKAPAKAPSKSRARGSAAGPGSEARTTTVRRARRINSALDEVYYYAHPELDFENPFELLVATVLSAQTTDLRVNQTTPALFARYPTPEDMAAADPERLAELIRPTGFFNAKSKSLLGLSAALCERFGGEVPGRIEDLVSLPGVGRKTAFVVLGNAFGVPGLTVDTHFGRLVRRWKLTEQTDPEKVEREIAELLPKSEWTMFSHRTIFHGRRVCHSRKPACGACPIAELCPSYGEGELDPEKAKKLLKYEMGGKPGQRLKPPADYPGMPAPPLASAGPGAAAAEGAR